MRDCAGDIEGRSDIYPPSRFGDNGNYGVVYRSVSGYGSYVPTTATVEVSYGCETAKYVVVDVPEIDFQLGQACPSCQNGPDPVSPSSGQEYLTESDFILDKRVNIRRYYNSRDTQSAYYGIAWRSFFSRSIEPVYPPTDRYSSKFDDLSTACTQGWLQLRNSSVEKQTWTAQLDNGQCVLYHNGQRKQTLSLLSGNSSLPPPAYHVTLDNGKKITFVASGNGYVRQFITLKDFFPG